MINLEGRLVQIIKKSPNIMTILETCRECKMPDWRLVSGAIYGTIFNHLTRRPLDYGIKDYDIAYFDKDTSYDAEDVWIRKIANELPQNLKELAEVRNQARVHIWFKNKFGTDYAPLNNTDESLNRYLCHAHAIAIRLEDNDEISIHAPFGLKDIFNMVLRHNEARGAYDKFLEKSYSIKERWREVTILTEK